MRHLGGNAKMTHVDRGALSYLVSVFAPQSFIDIGCSTGDMVVLAQQMGMRAIGVDGDQTVTVAKDYIITHDFTTGPLNCGLEYDLCWMVEFVEHVEERFLANFMQTVERARAVVMTHALPGVPGYHHVNCNTEEYWIDVFAHYGYHLDQEKTKELRRRSTMRRSFMRTTGKVFVRI